MKITRTRRTVGFSLVLTSIGLCLAVPGPPAGAAAVAAAPRLSWQQCDGPFECATARVPLDYDQPDGAHIRLALIRLPAGDPAHRIGSLFLNPGGPGGSGVDFVHFAGPFLLTPEVRSRFDLVGFDPRGVARSSPLRCFDTAAELFATLAPFPFPVTRADEEPWIAADRALVAGCDGRAGPIIDHMATADVARDLDLLRRAVGDRLLNYAGYSYGSFLGVTYANMFPNRFRALVVDGVLDPVAWTTGVGREARTVPVSTRLRSDAGAQATLDELFRLCDAGGPNCAFSGASAARYGSLAARLRAKPLVVPAPGGGTFVVDYAGLVAFTLGALYDSSSWPFLAQTLADLEAEVGPGVVEADLAALHQHLGITTKAGFARYPNFEAFPGVLCADSDNPGRYGPWSAQAALADATYGYFGRPWTWISSVCAVWHGVDADRYVGPFNRATANPVLVVGNQFDPATRYEGARRVAQAMPNSSLLTLHAWGHTSLFQSSCADEAVSRYLVEVRTPSPGTVCEQDVAPFSAGPPQAQAATDGRPGSASALLLPMTLRGR